VKRTTLFVVLTFVMSAAATALVGSPAHAQDGVDGARAVAFDQRLFAGPVGARTYACFVRHYDGDHLARHPKQDHLARHPKQKVIAMKLLVTAENPPEEKMSNYSFRPGVKYRHRSSNFDSSGYCNHVIAEDAGNEIRVGGGVDCEGGGINVALSKADKSAIIRLERIIVWNRNKPDDEAGDALLDGADDKISRVDRADVRDSAELVTDRQELAALRHK
jgi:hypothetical protein